MFLKVYRNKRFVLTILAIVVFYYYLCQTPSSSSSYASIEDNVDHNEFKERIEIPIRNENIIEEIDGNRDDDAKKRLVQMQHVAISTPGAAASVGVVVKNERVNFDNYVVPPACRACPGANGSAVEILPDEEAEVERVIAKEYFNLKASDRISLWRTVPDVRFPECKAKVYPSDLPSASVVIIFKDERWSPLLRTVYSVIHESPKHALKEILLVDDQSELDELGKRLTDYCDKFFGDMVKIIRTPKRLGLIRAKNFGAKYATGEVVVFLDSHCEAGKGWLEPLLARIKENRTTIVCPIINSIDAKTMKYQGGAGELMYGVFTWSLFFNWEKIPKRIADQRKSQADNYPSPTMAGGLLAVDRNYFLNDLSGYDEGMEIWGGENLEISFKVWMCGGSLEFVPCSNVGHIFRHGHPYNMTGEKGGKDVHGWNSMRVAEVWMDNYKRYYYMYRPDLKSKDHGDLSGRFNIRRRLKCHNFKWYLNNVYPEKFKLDEDVTAFGHLRVLDTNTCVDTLGIKEASGGNIGLFSCQNQSSVQMFSLSIQNELRREETCCYAAPGSLVGIRYCSGTQDEKWLHTKNGFLKHLQSGLCLDARNVSINSHPKLTICDTKNKQQLWQFENYLL